MAVECAKRVDGAIISCDALLVYRRLNVGTAKPTAEERRGIPHYLIDVADPRERFSVSDFERRALPILEGILYRRKTPVICGVTGFYMNALLFRSSFGNAAASEEIRTKYEKIAELSGREYLHVLLREVDSETAEKLHPNDVKRVIRALEIFELTGRKKSEQHDAPIPRYPYSAFAFDYPREILYDRIGRRIDGMLLHGLVSEVKGLLAAGIPENAQCMQGIGYKEVVECLKNGNQESIMRDIIARNTRNYAKRQLTFFKKLPELHFIEPKPIEKAAKEVVDIYES